jgi:endonuclease/exonuclease/phosphatase family metal-dependent hydrolase
LKKFYKNSFFLVLSLPFLLLIGTYLAPSTHPEQSKLMPILAYLYPYVMLVCIISFGIILVARQWKYLIFTCLVFLAGWNVHLSYFAWGKPKTNSEENIAIMSYNVRNFDLYEQLGLGSGEGRDKIFQFLEQQNLDIICFQEFFHEERPRKFVTYNKISELTGLPHHVQSMTSDNKQSVFFGCVIFSKFPIVRSGKLEIPSTASNHCVFADINRGSDTIRIYNFHIGSISFNEEEYGIYKELDLQFDEQDKEKGKRLIKRFLTASKKRAQHLETILSHAAESPYPTILCGDLNDTPTSYAYNQLSKIYDDAFKKTGRGFGQTYKGKMPDNRIDYIFYDKQEFEAAAFFIQEELLSDHLAIVARLNLIEK